MIVCRQCGAENRAEARFCDSCGAALVPADASAREERKVVTVLFADLVGFTSRAEQMDPEDVRAVLEPYHAHLRSELERYGGTVEKFIGDAVIALGAQPSEGEGMASGDVVNTAARLQSAAPVNGILVDETTYRATAQAISYAVF